MSSRFFTNENENTLLKKFEGVFASNPELARFDALVGYLRASGYFAIRPFLKSVPNVRILVGINVDNILEQYHLKGQLFLADAGKALKEFRDGLIFDIQTARYSREVENGIIQFVEDVTAGKVEIKAHPTKRLHAKIYIFLPQGFNEHKPGHVITGSSNLTASGLGALESKQAQTYEFNALSHDYEDVKFASTEFEKLWNESVAVLPKEVTEVTRHSYLREDITPFELYYKLLIEFFGPAIEYDPNSEADLPEGFMRLTYQQDAVTQGFLLLQKHHGFFLADVVGLGKTIIAILIAKKFFYHNGFPSHISSTLIVVPPALRDSWQETVDRFELKGAVDIVTNGSLHKVTNVKKYDLVIVDEAHKFRNDTAESYDHLQRICKTRTTHRFPDGSYYRKRVILVSATPLNNRPLDIRNLLLLFQDGKDATLEVPNLQRFFATRQKEYQKALKDPDPHARLEIKRIYELIRFKVVEEITIRRTRTDLLEHDDYRKDIEAQGLIFPKVNPPRKILYPLSPELEALYDATLAELEGGLTYNRYRAIGHLVPEKRLKYVNAERISSQLARIMRTLLLKRIDSSFFAFTKSLLRFRDATRAMVTMFDNGTVYIAPKLNVSEYIIEEREEELAELLISLQDEDPTIEICTPEDFDASFRTGLEKDAVVLDDLAARWSAVEGDPKFAAFLEHLDRDFLSTDLNHEANSRESPKLVVFSESKETTEYLVEKLATHGHDRILAIDSTTRKNRMPWVRTNFDANHPKDEQLDDFEILISTEVLAEGVNLHRANIIVNYDTPWNSTRLMQRIGRINRIGSTAPEVHVFNFFPTAKVDADIDLQKRAIAKLQAFHSALGEDSQIYSTEEEVDNFGLFDSELQEEKDETLALLMELRQFRRESPEHFREIRNLPLRARLGRNDRNHAGSTITFVRNRRRDGFYHIRLDNTIDELSFVEAARIFHANAREQAAPLPEYHHEQVNLSVVHYRETLQTEAVRDQIVDHQIGPNERKAVQFLSIFINHPTLASKEEKTLLKNAQIAVRKATFANLQRDLVKLEKAHKKAPLKPATLLDQTLAIVQKYPLAEQEDEFVEDVGVGLSTAELEPAIILSESFSFED